MSKADKIQNQLYKAYGKVARKLGYPFDIIRSDTTSDPIKEVNVISRQLVSVSKDDKYSRSQKTEVPLWTCWIDGRLDALFDLERGDYLHNWETNDTFLVVSTHPHLPIQVLTVNNNISVYSSGYSDTGNGFAPGDMEVAINLPSYRSQPSSSGGTLGYIPGSNNASISVPNYEYYLLDIQKVISIGDAIVDQDGNRSQVMTIHETEVYTKIVTTAYEAS